MEPVLGRGAAAVAGGRHRAHPVPVPRGLRAADRGDVLRVAFDVAPEVAFDYLVDPRNRPEWQSSLRRVERVDGHVGVGQTWVDVTAAGVRPAMETTALDRPLTWTERGTWRGIEAVLTLRFVRRDQGCEVVAEVAVTGRGVARSVGPLLTRAARLAVPHDLRRAARILSERRAAH